MILEQADPIIQEPIGVLGYGVEGISTCNYLLQRGFTDITVLDRKRPSNLDPRLKFGEGYVNGIATLRTLFRSAGVRPDLPEIAEFIRKGGTLTSQTGLAFSLAGHDRIIGVTGTLGKGTCCSLLSAMLTEAGIPAALGGNIGIPALDLASSLPLGEKLILELSSFQLSTLPKSPRFAAVLKTTSEHLDWHLHRDEYWLHKSNLVATQTAEDTLTYCADTEGSAWIASKSKGKKIPFGENSDIFISGSEVTFSKWGFSLPLSATRLTGEFNLENLAAAGVLALELGAKPNHVLAAAAAFNGLEHRLEFVRELEGVSFYNDSYATRPDATIGAIAALAKTPLGLILGGSDKQADFSGLTKQIASASHVKAIALIGQTAEKLQSELQRVGFLSSLSLSGRSLKKSDSLEEAVEFLRSQVKTGCIALSPACASFGMFENYKERGKSFKRLIAGL